MSQEVKIEVRHSRGWAVGLIVSALVLLGINIVPTDNFSLVVGLIAGGTNLVIGIQMLYMPAYVLRAQSLEFKNPLGMTLKRVEVASLSEFEVDAQRTVWQVDGKGQRKKMKIAKVGMRRSDLERFYRAIEVGAFD